jgi:hypothetical protein
VLRLSNRYFALRHGQSIPNVKGIIVSDPKEGTYSRNSRKKSIMMQ